MLDWIWTTLAIMGGMVGYGTLKWRFEAWVADLVYLIAAITIGLIDAFTGSTTLSRLLDTVIILFYAWMLWNNWQRRKRKRAPKLAGYKARAIQAKLKAALNPT